VSYLSLSLLGGFEAKLGDATLSGFSTDKVRALLAYLAVEGRRPHRREALAGLLWPGYPERSARTSLRHALANLRRVLGDPATASPFLLVEGETIQLNPQAQVWVDVVELEKALSGTKSPPAAAGRLPTAAVSGLEQAVALYRGAFLEGFSLADSPEFED
jgi:DNA-binding SARP family transcriptional activator